SHEATAIARAYNHLGLAYQDSASSEGLAHALGYFRAALDMEKEVHPRPHPTLAEYYSNVGRAHFRLRRYDLALRHFQRALEMEESLHPDTADYSVAHVLNDLGKTHRHLGHPNEAEACLQRAVAMERQLDDQPDMAISLVNLGLVHRQLNNLQEALRDFEAALGIERKLHAGVDHIDVVHTLDNLGNTYEDSGNLDAAATHYSEALEMLFRLYPGEPRHLEIRNMSRKLRRVQPKTRKYPQIRRFFTKRRAVQA
ncbi:MAG: tetratricopeptide repeat protein, partial [Bacteroidota bacterium]